ncbi:uncharacterized protein J8A68_000834 [[Candida] subhashii]|uniref:Uncharacterized protein n=1 Tax=[Candida] subhashii TaxID=561895 RepID=A0A8J5UKR4_9ASCO|nr:uncharacterized protein J8A68_000834 [[Candida] subhashii]KAG7665628.1 hypothetical protein J8A68_000834 [[Candida] subhashii]
MLSNVLRRKSHEESVCQLYKQLLRQSNKLKKIDPSILASHINHQNPQQFLKHTAFELRFNLKEQFRSPITNELELSEKLISAIQLNQILDQTITSNQWDELFKFRDQQRTQTITHQKHTSSRLARQVEILAHQGKTLRGLEMRLHYQSTKNAKHKSSTQSHNKTPSQQFIINSEERNRQRLNQAREQIGAYCHTVLNNHLRNLQADQEIPNPNLLPYTPEKLQTKGDQYYAYNFEDRTTKRAVSEAYDKEYLYGIVIPGLEYDINYKYNFNKIKKIINEKGPWVVRANKATVAGIPFLKLPHWNSDKITLARFIRRYILAMRIMYAWEAVGSIDGEKLQRDGSFHIRGSGGFGSEGRMFPRAYYEELVEGEIMYEGLLQIEENKMKDGNENVKINFRGLEKEWYGPLEESSLFVKEQVDNLFKDIDEYKGEEFEEKRARYQKEMFRMYERKLSKYEKLLEDLSKFKVHKHSEIVSPPCTVSIRKKLKARDLQGILPRVDRIGKGKTLGDFLQHNELYDYQYGYGFTKRFRFKETPSTKLIEDTEGNDRYIPPRSDRNPRDRVISNRSDRSPTDRPAKNYSSDRPPRDCTLRDNTRQSRDRADRDSFRQPRDRRDKDNSRQPRDRTDRDNSRHPRDRANYTRRP